MMQKSRLLTIALLAGTPVLGAPDAGLSPGYDACLDKAAGVTSDMIECIIAETERQDGRLNRAYKRVMSALAANRRTELQQVQRLWIKYRDANCAFYNDSDGGSMARVSAHSCLLDATTERARELEGFLDK